MHALYFFFMMRDRVLNNADVSFDVLIIVAAWPTNFCILFMSYLNATIFFCVSFNCAAFDGFYFILTPSRNNKTLSFFFYRFETFIKIINLVVVVKTL